MTKISSKNTTPTADVEYSCMVCGQPATALINDVATVPYGGISWKVPSSNGPYFYCEEHKRESVAVEATQEDFDRVVERQNAAARIEIK